MDVQSSAGGNLSLEFTVTADFTVNITGYYSVVAAVNDLIWSNLSTTSATLTSFVSDAYIGNTDCPGGGCVKDLQAPISATGSFPIPYDPALAFPPGTALDLSGSWSSGGSILLVDGSQYSLVLDTTFTFSGLASGEVLRIDLPEWGRCHGTGALHLLVDGRCHGVGPVGQTAHPSLLARLSPIWGAGDRRRCREASRIRLPVRL
jgi:hypothetical protein